MKIGVDVSHWQGDMDWKKCRQAGATFAILRAGSIGKTGNPYEDSQWARNIAIAPQFLPVGAYWYFRGSRSWAEQVNYFIGLLKPHRAKLCGAFIDVETLSTAQNVESFMVYLTKAFPEMQRGIYTGPNAWMNLVTGGVDQKKFASKYPLWIANYGVTSPHIPYPWTDYACWQHSADGNGRGAEFGAGGSVSIDINTAQDWFLGTSIIPPVDPPTLPKQVTPTASIINIRSAPVISRATDIGDIAYGTLLPVLAEEGEWYKVRYNVEGYVHKSVVKTV